MISNPYQVSSTTQNQNSALFIDFENVYYFLRERLPERSEAADVTIGIIRDLRQRLAASWQTNPVVLHAYADFERIEENVQGPLYLMGVVPHYVLGSDHKNAADMRLTIDALDVFYTRRDIGTFVVVAGDRDYIPLLQHLNQHSRRILVASFMDNVSGDLLEIIGKNRFIDLATLLPEGTTLKPADNAPAKAEIPPKPETFEEAIAQMSIPSRFRSVQKLQSDQLRQALGVALKYFGDKPEIWITPLLHKLRNEMPLLAEYERKSLLSQLEDYGALKVEKKRGEQNDYSVAVLNWNHPDVQDLYED